MPTRCYVLEDVLPKQLEVSWTWGQLFRYTDISLRVNGETVSPVLQEEDLEKGYEFGLHGGSSLKTQIMHSNLYVWQDGKKLRGSIDPNVIIPNAYKLVLLAGGLKAITGFLVLISQAKPFEFVARLFPDQQAHPEYMGVFGTGSLIVGLAFVAVGLLIRQQSLVALFAAIVLIIFDEFFLESTLGLERIGPPSLSNVYDAVVFVVLLVQGVIAVRNLRKLRER